MTKETNICLKASALRQSVFDFGTGIWASIQIILFLFRNEKALHRSGKKIFSQGYKTSKCFCNEHGIAVWYRSDAMLADVDYYLLNQRVSPIVLTWPVLLNGVKKGFRRCCSADFLPVCMQFSHHYSALFFLHHHLLFNMYIDDIHSIVPHRHTHFHTNG